MTRVPITPAGCRQARHRSEIGRAQDSRLTAGQGLPRASPCERKAGPEKGGKQEYCACRNAGAGVGAGLHGAHVANRLSGRGLVRGEPGGGESGRLWGSGHDLHRGVHLPPARAQDRRLRVPQRPHPTPVSPRRHSPRFDFNVPMQHRHADTSSSSRHCPSRCAQGCHTIAGHLGVPVRFSPIGYPHLILHVLDRVRFGQSQARATCQRPTAVTVRGCIRPHSTTPHPGRRT